MQCVPNLFQDTILSHYEIKLLLQCVERCQSKLVYEYCSRHDWYLCPQCHAVIEREYMSNCCCCGQSLKWWGSVKHCVRVRQLTFYTDECSVHKLGLYSLNTITPRQFAAEFVFFGSSRKVRLRGRKRSIEGLNL